MKVILLQDVPNVGKKFQEAEVANGYGSNYLIPNGLAQVATEETLARYSAQQEAAEAARQEAREKLATAVETIDGSTVTITVENAGDQGQLFAGIYPQDIAAAVNKEFGVDIAGVDIDRDAPISKVGEEDVTVSILDTTVTVTVEVTADNFTDEADPDADEEEVEEYDEDFVDDEVADEEEE
ncbi:MAG: 50S ribosomal protein L9 [Candidatus Paceibacterota bacterium]